MPIKLIQYRIEVTSSSEDESFVLSPKVIELIDERDSLFVWDSARLLSAYLATNRSLFQQRRCVVLELGAGLGLPSIVAAMLGAKSVYITERAEEHTTLDNIRKIIEINKVDDRCRAYPLTWGVLPKTTDTTSSDVDGSSAGSGSSGGSSVSGGKGSSGVCWRW